MDNQVSEKANELLLQLIDKTQGAMDFAETQIPDVIHQLLVWKSVTSLLVFAACLAAMCGIFVARRSLSKALELKDVGDAVFTWSMSILASAIPVAIASDHGLDWLKIWLAPKVYLLEYAASLAK